MRQRGLVVAVAFLLAIGATAAVFLYVRGVRDEARTGGALVTVIVSNQDVPAGTDLNPLIDQGAFRELAVPEDALVDGAVTSLEQLRGQTTTTAILANEQIPVDRLSSGALPGGTLGITKGYEAVTVQISAEQAVGNAIQRGAHVTVYTLFNQVTGRAGSPATQSPSAVPGTVFTVIPDVRVLDVINPNAGTNEAGGNVQLTLELTPVDVQKLVFAQQLGTVWLGLLPPGEKGVSTPPVSFLQVVKK